MKNNYKLFDRHSFRKSLKHENKWGARSVINIAFFDVLSWAFSRMSYDAAENNTDEISNRVVNLVWNSKFEHAITHSTNSTVQVRTRFRMVEEALSEWMEA